MKALLVVPSICDFAAHDMWAAPYGLMTIASAFRSYGIEFDILDFLGREYVSKEYGDGRRRYKRTIIDTPEVLKGKSIKRYFAIYGANLLDIDDRIESIYGEYDIILITTTMTYWYYGYQIIYNKLKKRFKNARFVIGGVYPSLIEGHCRSLFPDALIITNENLPLFDKFISEVLNRDFFCFSRNFPDWQLPDVEGFSYRRYIPVLLTRGCPFRCTYCASGRLVADIENKDPIRLADWVIEMAEKTGIRDIALFDDAFLVNHRSLAVPFLKRLSKSKMGFRIHASNGLHPRFIDENMANIMRESNFTTIRLSLESSNEERLVSTGGKVRRDEYETALENLRKVGYRKSDLGTYLICGIPHQTPEEVLGSIRYVDECGGVVYLAEFSPIPDTPLFDEALRISRYDLNEPLWQNNTLMSYWNPIFNEDILNNIKAEVIKRRKEPTTGFEPVTY